MKAILVAALVAAGVGIAAPAHAAVDCEHRSKVHVDQHGGLDADSAWHVAHGQRPTCDKPDNSGSNEDDNNDDRGPRRDHFGFHCTWRGCG